MAESGAPASITARFRADAEVKFELLRTANDVSLWKASRRTPPHWDAEFGLREITSYFVTVAEEAIVQFPGARRLEMALAAFEAEASAHGQAH